MDRKVYLIGIGMGNRDTLTIGALKAIEKCKYIIGAGRMLAAFGDMDCEKKALISASDISEYIGKIETEGDVAVVMSGDIGFYSGAKKLYELLKGERVETICGISAVQYLCGKTQRSWENVKLLSAHGRDCQVVEQVLAEDSVFVLTEGGNSINEICRKLCENGLGQAEIVLGENLSYENEKITFFKAEEGLKKTFAPLGAMLIQNTTKIKSRPVSYGIPDEAFQRGEIPMTKGEVRSIAIAKLQIEQGHTVYDIGAGTGSVSVEAALQARFGKVYALEQKEEACELIIENAKKFHLANLTVIKAKAPEGMETLPIPDCAFIGGSGGNLDEIIGLLIKKNPNIRIVVSAIALETLNQAVESFKKYKPANIEIVQVTISKARTVSNYHMMMGQNPVFIISGGGKNYDSV